MRKGIDTLAYLFKEKFELDHFSNKVGSFVAVSTIDLKLYVGTDKAIGALQKI